MQLEDVSICNGMIPADLLAVETIAAPHTGIFDRLCHFAVDEAGHVRHCFASPNGKGPRQISCLTGNLRIDTNYSEVGRQPSPDLLEIDFLLSRDRKVG